MRGLRLGAILDRLGRRPAPPSAVIVGLGNPGTEYTDTRHNLGFWCLDLLARAHSITLSRRHRSALLGEGVIQGHRVALVKPRTFVNRSGAAASYLLARYRIPPERLLVIYDELELPLGKIRLRPEGGAGGHNGIKSIIETIGTPAFPRLRIGIGRPPAGVDPVEYVLGTMAADERERAGQAVERAADAVVAALVDGVPAAMNRFN